MAEPRYNIRFRGLEITEVDDNREFKHHEIVGVNWFGMKDETMEQVNRLFEQGVKTANDAGEAARKAKGGGKKD